MKAVDPEGFSKIRMEERARMNFYERTSKLERKIEKEREVRVEHDEKETGSKEKKKSARE